METPCHQFWTKSPVTPRRKIYRITEIGTLSSPPLKKLHHNCRAGQYKLPNSRTAYNIEQHQNQSHHERDLFVICGCGAEGCGIEKTNIRHNIDELMRTWK